MSTVVGTAGRMFDAAGSALTDARRDWARTWRERWGYMLRGPNWAPQDG